MAQVLNRVPLGKHRGIDPSDRRRSWLDSYESTRWTVSDSAGGGESHVIDFDVRMADGLSLIHHADLYATAKELVFWIRAGNFTRIDDSLRHSQYGQAMLRLCYGLTARGFWSFASLSSIDIDTICEEAAFGADGLTRSSVLVRDALARFETWEEVPDQLMSGNKFNLRSVKEAFRLPKIWAAAEIRSEIEVASARLDGHTLVSVAALKEEPITVQNIHLVTNIFEALFALRDYIDATPISFRPFPEGAARRAVALGRGTNRTPVPPPELALRLLENTTRYFIDHHEHVLGSYRLMIDGREGPDWAFSRADDAASRVKSLAVSCFILIAAFTARRVEEIKLLRRDCLHGSDADGYWMRVYVEKTERQLTWIPVPVLVARAVEMLRSLTPDGETTIDATLFQYRDPRTGRMVQLSPESMLNEFATSVGAGHFVNDNTKQTETWSWTTRQFRRLFAVMFFYRYKGKIQTLAHHLRHFDSRMTNDYVTKDPDVAKLWDQEVWRHQVEIARDIVSGRTTYTGAMGKRLTQLVDRLRRKFSDKAMVVSEAVGAALVRQLRKGQFVLTPKLWVTCSCPRTKKACEKAACRKVAGYGETDIGPDFSAAGPTVCPDCPFAMIGPENLAYIEEQAGAMTASIQVIEADGPTIFGELQAAHALKLIGTTNGFKAA